MSNALSISEIAELQSLPDFRGFIQSIDGAQVSGAIRDDECD